VETPLHGAHRHTEHRRDLGHRALLDVVQHDERAWSGVEAREGAADRVSLGRVLGEPARGGGLGRGVPPGGVDADLPDRGAIPLAHQCPAEVDEDAGQPDVEAERVSQAG